MGGDAAAGALSDLVGAAVRAGALDRRVTLLAPEPLRGAAGGYSESWAPVARICAKVTDLTGREFFAAAQVNAEVTTKFLIRYRAGVTPQMRVRWRDRDYDIVTVAEVGGRDDGIEIMAKARVVGAG